LRVRVGDVAAVRERSRQHPSVLDALQNPPLERPEWLSVDQANLAATVRHLPSDVMPPFPVELQRVVEYYATRL
jgi:small subunit ribosomal protein S4